MEPNQQQPTEIDQIIDRLARRIGELEVGIAVTSVKLQGALKQLEAVPSEEPVARPGGAQDGG